MQLKMANWQFGAIRATSASARLRSAVAPFKLSAELLDQIGPIRALSGSSVNHSAIIQTL